MLLKWYENSDGQKVTVCPVCHRGFKTQGDELPHHRENPLIEFPCEGGGILLEPREAAEEVDRKRRP